jgi:hypothetical protein
VQPSRSGGRSTRPGARKPSGGRPGPGVRRGWMRTPSPASPGSFGAERQPTDLPVTYGRPADSLKSSNESSGSTITGTTPAACCAHSTWNCRDGDVPLRSTRTQGPFSPSCFAAEASPMGSLAIVGRPVGFPKSSKGNFGSDSARTTLAVFSAPSGCAGSERKAGRRTGTNPLTELGLLSAGPRPPSVRSFPGERRLRHRSDRCPRPQSPAEREHILSGSSPRSPQL